MIFKRRDKRVIQSRLKWVMSSRTAFWRHQHHQPPKTFELRERESVGYHAIKTLCIISIIKQILCHALREKVVLIPHYYPVSARITTAITTQTGFVVAWCAMRFLLKGKHHQHHIFPLFTFTASFHPFLLNVLHKLL